MINSKGLCWYSLENSSGVTPDAENFGSIKLMKMALAIVLSFATDLFLVLAVAKSDGATVAALATNQLVASQASATVAAN
jgi:hypothetical protein